MNYWLTTHWPQRADESETDRFSDTGVWVANGKQAVISEMQRGDMLFIYESKTGKTSIEMTAKGTQTRVPRKQGQQGVIALAEIASVPAEIEGSLPDKYTDGSEIWWRFNAAARVINSNGFIDRRSLAKILGYQENYPFHGFGDQKSGVKKLSADVFAAIHSAFLTSQKTVKTVLKRKQSYGGHDSGGEGPLHKSLKEFIATQPDVALKEEGLETIQVEYPFLTGDRIDILLKDKNGRLVTVEVEVDCDDSEMAGPLQCMKYRSLIAYLSETRVAEVRTVLVARSVASSVQKRCRAYEIQVVKIPKWPGADSAMEKNS